MQPVKAEFLLLCLVTSLSSLQDTRPQETVSLRPLLVQLDWPMLSGSKQFPTIYPSQDALCLIPVWFQTNFRIQRCTQRDYGSRQQIATADSNTFLGSGFLETIHSSVNPIEYCCVRDHRIK